MLTKPKHKDAIKRMTAFGTKWSDRSTSEPVYKRISSKAELDGVSALKYTSM